MGRMKEFLLYLWISSSTFWAPGLSVSLGKEFITAYMQNFGSRGHFELQISGHFDGTTVTVTVPCRVCGTEFKKKITVNKESVELILLPDTVEIIGSKLFSEVIRISADKEVSVVSLSSKPLSTEIALLYPVNILGTEHYVVAPTLGPSGTSQEFSVLSHEGNNVVDIYLKNKVVFNGKEYPAESKLTVTLEASQGLQLQGTGDLSGTKIISQKPVAVLSGHICSWKYTKCNHVFEQLLPVARWGKEFMAPPLPWQTKSDILFVSASQNTALKYQIGAKTVEVNLKGGQVIQIMVLPQTPVFLLANVPIQVLFYSTGATYQTFVYDTFLMGIPDINMYSRAYGVFGQINFQNFVLLVMKTSEVNGLTVAGKPLFNVKWNNIPGTDSSWGLYQLQRAAEFYRIEHPEVPFALFSVGLASLNCYGTTGAGFEAAPTLTCSNVLCSKGMECKIINGQPHCVPSSEATCWAWGDPHYHTFDQRNYDFQGTCTYTIAKTCDGSFGLPSFHISAKNENRGNKQVSYVGMVTIEVYGYTITILRSEKSYVRVNGLLAHLPLYLNRGKLQLLQSGTSVLLTTDFQLQVSYDWNHHLRITVTSAYYGGVCGLCGNYNEDPGDDFQTPAGTTAPDAVAFGKSWKVEDDGGETCWHDCHGPCLPCPSDLAQKYQTELYCGLITKISGGPFAPCHSKVNPKFYFDSCVFDICSNQGHRQSLCDALETYAEACQKEGLKISEWRKEAGCFLDCPPNSEYQLCGTACPATCMDDQHQEQTFCPAVCVEGCQCLPGYVLSQGKCVPASSCGCLHEGRPFAPNEGFWADDTCRKWCVCNPTTRKVECADKACKTTEQCKVVKGVRGCYPTSYGTCTAIGDPHYLSFDNYKFDFQGACAYVFSEVCQRPKDLEWFGIYVQNEHRGNRAVTYTRSVQVNVYDIEIIVSRQYPGKILVGGLLTFLPYSPAGGRVRVYKKGQNAVIEADFGLTVTFNWDSRVAVTVPTTYANTLCGLCGNFNKNPTDDALVPGSVPSRPVFDAPETKVFDSRCNEILDPKCPGLEALAAQQRASGQGCGLIVAKDGPFRECHGHVDPEGAFQDCTYDNCFFKGRYTFVCAGIASYMAACQAAGVTVYPWRSSTFCPPSCPVNSHYEVCAKGCGQTCSSLYFPIPCLARCEEDCVCNEGFVRSNAACVPIAECGCFYQGRYYPVSEVFYPTCQERCSCQAGGNVVCEVVACGPNEECKLVDGYQKCSPAGSANCSLVGDLYLSFDGLPIDFKGTCSYILTKLTKKDANLQPLTVVVQNEAWGNGNIAVPTLVSVEIFDVVLSLWQNKWEYVMVDGVFHRLPVNLLDGHLRIYQHGFYIWIETSFGFKLSYDAFYHVRVTVPSSYQGQLSGLCGNYNRLKEDDLQLPDGTTVSDVAVFAAAWKIPNPGIPCTDGCSAKSCPLCGEKKKEFFKQRTFCGILTASDGPFSSCHPVVDPMAYLDHCILDLCIGGGDQQSLCHSIQSYVAACQVAKVSIQPWRKPDFCPVTCPANSHYAICSNICETGCAGLTDHVECPETCAEGCQCDDGFFSDGVKCISLDECGCFEHNTYFPPNELILLNNCTEECVCSPAGGFFCETHACSADESCEIKDGILQCQDKDPCKAKTCRPKETCQIKEGQAVCVPDFTGNCGCWGDPHYHTFDGYRYDFQGTCSYVLSQLTGHSESLVPFSVVTKNENRGASKAVSYVRQVLIQVHGLEITILRGENGRIRVNGMLFNLPVSLLGGRVSIFSSGNRANVQTDFGLVVTFDWNWTVDLYLPSSYFNSTGGLCGNFNQLPADDRRGPDDSLLPNVISWATSWEVEDGDPLCFNECRGTCLMCDGPKLEKYKVDGLCGIISIPTGPFQSCHVVLDPAVFLNNCALDVCMNEGDHDILCQAVGSYAQACDQLGHRAGDWRTRINCPLPCPANSHYVACGSGCPATCFSQNAPLSCSQQCVETCQCDDGYILSTTTCVPVESCGCSYNGFYYKPGEEFWEHEDCGSRCKCDSSLGVVLCIPAACQTGEQCRVVNGVRGCYPTFSTCTSARDYHYTTFDGRHYKFEGSCTYQLAKVCSLNSALTPFDISVQNSPAPEGRAVTLQVDGTSITLYADRGDTVQVNGNTLNLPFNHKEQILVRSDESHFAIVADFGLTIKLFKENLSVEATVPGNFAGSLCGLCGNANGDPGDEKIEEYGENWRVGCSPGCSTDCPAFRSAELESYHEDQYCGLLTRLDGPFASCHSTIPVAAFFEECINRTFGVRGRESVWCDVISAYVAACQAKSFPLRHWRTDTFCPHPCPATSHYELCGNRCTATCENPQLPLLCKAPCGEGCFCDPGYILSGKHCVPLRECACEFEGVYYKIGAEFFNTFCRIHCRCMEDGSLQCRDFCPENDACKVVGDASVCFPREPGTCYALDGWNYITFDDVHYSLPDSCSYILAQSDGQDNFSVVISAGSNGIEEVQIQASGYHVVLQRGKGWEILVNGECLLLPADFRDIAVRQEGKTMLLRSRSGLRVYYDLHDWVAVSLPGTFQGLLRGLCGNFNKKKNDEFLLPGGEPAHNLTEFGASWKVDGGHCSEGCRDKCHICEKDMGAEIQGKDSCGLIQAVSGPFRGCHATVDPTHFFNHCVARLCAASGAPDSLCQSLQAYATACQAAGATIGPWRTENFCPPNCLPDTHYELCAQSCNSTCARNLLCLDPCFEGCVCNVGTKANGSTCVNAKQCGCWRNGRLTQQGESYLLSDCGTRCTCQGPGQLICLPHSCGTGEACGLRNGLRGCFPTEGGCIVGPGDRFSSFDGLSGEMPAPGAYQMASLGDAHSDDWFRVIVSIASCLPSQTNKVALHIFFRNLFITVNGQKEVWVNGLPAKIPLQVTNSLRFDLIGDVITLQTHQMQITFGPNGRVAVIVTSALEGKVGGACGNFNYSPVDDLKGPDGMNVSSISELLVSWTARDFAPLCV